MKKLLVLAALLSVWACKKEGLTPDPLVEEVVEKPVEDTSKHNLINDWKNYQYKYTDPDTKHLWIFNTDWKVRMTKDTLMVDEAKDGTYEKKYPVSFQTAPTMSICVMTVPGPNGFIQKSYEIRNTRVGNKKGYDLIGLDPDKDVYSFIK